MEIALDPGYPHDDPVPPLPRVTYEGMFNDSLDTITPFLRSSAPILDSIKLQLADSGGGDISRALTPSLNRALDRFGTERELLEPTVRPNLIGWGNNTEVLYHNVQYYGIDVEDLGFRPQGIDNPDPAVIHTGRGFDTFIFAPPKAPSPPRPGPTPSPPSGPTGEPSGGDAAAIVTELYHEILGRDPDPSGLDTYTQFLESGGTADGLRDILCHSDEYLSQHGGVPCGGAPPPEPEPPAPEPEPPKFTPSGDDHADHVAAVTAAYREILGRDPDPSGLDTYVGFLDRGEATIEDIRAILYNSDEYRASHGG